MISMSFEITDFLFGDRGYLEVCEKLGAVSVFAKGCDYWVNSISGAMVREVGERGSFWCDYWVLDVGILRWCVGETAITFQQITGLILVKNTP